MVAGTFGGCGVCGRSPCPVTCPPQWPPFSVAVLVVDGAETFWWVEAVTEP